MLAPVEVLLHGTELEPADLVTLIRNVNLVQDVSFARPPEQTTEHLMIKITRLAVDREKP